MASIRLAVDWIYGQASDSKLARKVVELLCNAGHDAQYVGWGPNRIQEHCRSNSCDIMIQLAGGKCFGTLGDFYYGTQIQGYYKAKGFAFLYYNCWSETWPCHREPRDTFSWSLDLTRWEGKTLPWTFNDMRNTLGKKAYYGYGNSAEELVKTFLANLGGSSSSTDGKNDQQSQGNSILDLMKQVLTDIDPYGAELTLTGDTVNIRKTKRNDATILNDSSIINNSETNTICDNSTPNKYRNFEEPSLIDWFGLIELSEEEVPPYGDDDELILRLAQRGHNKSVELKCLINPDHMEGKWVILTNKNTNTRNWPYYITKSSYEEDRIMSLTLEPGPPIRRTEVVEETVDEEVIDDTDTDDDSGDDT